MSRIFTARPFARAARKAAISDEQLCVAAREVMAGRGDKLGNGVWKKRLDQNRRRAIVLARGRRYWVFQYLFDKQDRSNIDDDELRAFRMLAGAYAELNDEQVGQLVSAGDWKEICHGTKEGEERRPEGGS